MFMCVSISCIFTVALTDFRWMMKMTCERS